MELQEQLSQLQAAKGALDSMYWETTQALHIAKTNLILKEQAVQDLTGQINKLLKEIEELKQLNETGIEL